MRIISDLRILSNNWQLLAVITMRELKVRYKQSILGVGWAILQPLSLMFIFTLVFSKFAKVPSQGVPYPIFAFSALLPWMFLATSLSFAVPSVINNSDLITKVHFPNEVFPIASVLAALVDFGVGMVIFMGMMFFYSIKITPKIIWFIPILLIQFVLIFGIALFVSAFGVKYRDIKHATSLVLQLWLYATPVAYPLGVVPESYQWIFRLNPMVPIIENYRKVLLFGVSPDFKAIITVFIFSLILISVAYIYFKKSEREFADII